MKVAINQSNYISWKGYFDMIKNVDLFILYDDVQYTRRDWRNRNLIKTPNGLKWLTENGLNWFLLNAKSRGWLNFTSSGTIKNIAMFFVEYAFPLKISILIIEGSAIFILFRKNLTKLILVPFLLELYYIQKTN